MKTTMTATMVGSIASTGANLSFRLGVRRVVVIICSTVEIMYAKCLSFNWKS